MQLLQHPKTLSFKHFMKALTLTNGLGLSSQCFFADCGKWWAGEDTTNIVQNSTSGEQAIHFHREKYTNMNSIG